jgi:hypothetical protein
MRLRPIKWRQDSHNKDPRLVIDDPFERKLFAFSQVLGEGFFIKPETMPIADDFRPINHIFCLT